MTRESRGFPFYGVYISLHSIPTQPLPPLPLLTVNCSLLTEIVHPPMLSPLTITKLNDLPIEQVADALGLTVKQHRSLCPFHADSTPSLHYNVSKNKYHCYVCGAYGGPIDLTCQVNNLRFHQAVFWLAQTFDVPIEEEYKPFPNVQKRELKPVVKEQPATFEAQFYYRKIEHPLLTAEAQHFLFGQRKLDPRVIQWCRLSSTTTHLIIPYFDQNGALIGMQWRYLGQDKKRPRFWFPPGSKCSIYNLPVLNRLRPCEDLYITEGCSDCWAMLSAGHKAIAIPSATLLMPKDIEVLATIHKQYSTHFHMYPDQDAPGERLFLELRQHLHSQTGIDGEELLIRHQLPAGCKDFSDYYCSSKC